MVRQAGLEPATYCLEGSCSIQLSYWRVIGLDETVVYYLRGWCRKVFFCAMGICLDGVDNPPPINWSQRFPWGRVNVHRKKHPPRFSHAR